MAELSSSERRYAEAMQKVLTDPKVHRDLEKDPAGTLEKLGFEITPGVRAQLQQEGAAVAEVGVAAIPAVLVRVATQGTRPAVSVVVNSQTVAAAKKGQPRTKRPS